MTGIITCPTISCYTLYMYFNYIMDDGFYVSSIDSTWSNYRKNHQGMQAGVAPNRVSTPMKSSVNERRRIV